MTLASGTKLGPYEIVVLNGRGSGRGTACCARCGPGNQDLFGRKLLGRER